MARPLGHASLAPLPTDFDEVPEGIIVTLTGPICWELKAWILGFGGEAVVLEPPELVEEMRSTVAHMAEKYRLGNVARQRRVAPRKAASAPRGRRGRNTG